MQLIVIDEQNLPREASSCDYVARMPRDPRLSCFDVAMGRREHARVRAEAGPKIRLKKDTRSPMSPRKMRASWLPDTRRPTPGAEVDRRAIYLGVHLATLCTRSRSERADAGCRHRPAPSALSPGNPSYLVPP